MASTLGVNQLGPGNTAAEIVLTNQLAIGDFRVRPTANRGDFDIQIGDSATDVDTAIITLGNLPVSAISPLLAAMAIAGTIIDSTGAAVSGATVTAVSNETGEKRTVTTMPGRTMPSSAGASPTLAHCSSSVSWRMRASCLPCSSLAAW